MKPVSSAHQPHLDWTYEDLIPRPGPQVCDPSITGDIMGTGKIHERIDTATLAFYNIVGLGLGLAFDPAVVVDLNVTSQRPPLRSYMSAARMASSTCLVLYMAQQVLH